MIMIYSILFWILCLVVMVPAQESFKLSSGEGLAFCDNANTHSKGDVWVSGFGRAFYWDNPSVAKGGFPLKIFPCGSIDVGLMPFWDMSFSSELMTYGFKIPGNIRLKTKLTWPNNNKLRLLGFALSGAYTYNFLKNYASFGFRNDIAGFYPEGVMLSGGSIEWRAIADVELIQWKSFLPLKYYLNVGYRFSLSEMPTGIDNNILINPDPKRYGQYLFFTGLEYKGLGTDFFVEFHAEIFNTLKSMQTVTWAAPLKRFPIYFSENPMFLTPGLRIKYSNGVMLMAAVPIKMSREKGYPLRSLSLTEKTSPEAMKNGWTDGFSPFYPDWKVVGKMSIPLRFTMSNAEMIRKFLLMKNRGKKQVLDIDEAIDKKENKKDSEKSDEEKMKDDIEKRKQEMMKENLLE